MAAAEDSGWLLTLPVLKLLDRISLYLQGFARFCEQRYALCLLGIPALDYKVFAAALRPWFMEGCDRVCCLDCLVNFPLTTVYFISLEQI